jgi:hypothetical protein
MWGRIDGCCMVFLALFRFASMQLCLKEVHIDIFNLPGDFR